MLYCTILTIDLIIVFSSAPVSPSLIFTTGTSITPMACKKTNQQEVDVKHWFFKGWNPGKMTGEGNKEEKKQETNKE